MKAVQEEVYPKVIPIQEEDLPRKACPKRGLSKKGVFKMNLVHEARPRRVPSKKKPNKVCHIEGKVLS